MTRNSDKIKELREIQQVLGNGEEFSCVLDKSIDDLIERELAKRPATI